MKENEYILRIKYLESEVDRLLKIHKTEWIDLSEEDILAAYKILQEYIEEEDSNWIEHLVEKIKKGEPLKPIPVFLMPSGKYLILDGAHRYAAYKKADAQKVRVFMGTQKFMVDIEKLTFDIDPDLPPKTGLNKEWAFGGLYDAVLFARMIESNIKEKNKHII